LILKQKISPSREEKLTTEKDKKAQHLEIGFWSPWIDIKTRA
jgi:hypothetical protein